MLIIMKAEFGKLILIVLNIETINKILEAIVFNLMNELFSIDNR